jgi:hypothetical protein
MFFLLKLTSLSLSGIYSIGDLSMKLLIRLQTTVFPSSPSMAGQLPSHLSCDGVRVLIPSQITHTSKITRDLIAKTYLLAARLLNHSYVHGRV